MPQLQAEAETFLPSCPQCGEWLYAIERDGKRWCDSCDEHIELKGLAVKIVEPAKRLDVVQRSREGAELQRWTADDLPDLTGPPPELSLADQAALATLGASEELVDRVLGKATHGHDRQERTQTWTLIEHHDGVRWISLERMEPVGSALAAPTTLPIGTQVTVRGRGRSIGAIQVASTGGHRATIGSGVKLTDLVDQGDGLLVRCRGRARSSVVADDHSIRGADKDCPDCEGSGIDYVEDGTTIYLCDCVVLPPDVIAQGRTVQADQRCMQAFTINDLVPAYWVLDTKDGQRYWCPACVERLGVFRVPIEDAFGLRLVGPDHSLSAVAQARDVWAARPKEEV